MLLKYHCDKILLRAIGGARLIALNHCTTATLERLMNQPATPNQPDTAPPMQDEDDIGSGEKTPAEKETEELIRQIPPLPPAAPVKPR